MINKIEKAVKKLFEDYLGLSPKASAIILGAAIFLLLLLYGCIATFSGITSQLSDIINVFVLAIMFLLAVWRLADTLDDKSAKRVHIALFLFAVAFAGGILLNLLELLFDFSFTDILIKRN